MDGSAAPSPRRRPVEGGYARGEETRERIIEAAFVVFAEEGYVGASTRRIASEAGVNPPALQYYFHSKEGLHRACGQAIVDRVMLVLGPALDEARTAIAARDREASVAALCTLIEWTADFAMARVETEGWSRFLGRCQTDDLGPASAVVNEGISFPLKSTATALVACALGLEADDPIARLRAIFILSQMTALHHHRDHLLDLMDWPNFEAERAQTVKAVLRENVMALLG